MVATCDAAVQAALRNTPPVGANGDMETRGLIPGSHSLCRAPRSAWVLLAR